MTRIKKLEFKNTYKKLPEEFYHIVKPRPFENPFIVCLNPEPASLIDLDPDEHESMEEYAKKSPE